MTKKQAKMHACRSEMLWGYLSFQKNLVVFLKLNPIIYTIKRFQINQPAFSHPH